MAPLPPQLPAEVWVSVFEYLTATDKSNVRASCKYFKKLIDRGALWRDWTVILNFKKGPFNNHFWATLRRRKVSSVLVRSSKAKDWKQLAMSLPALSTVVMDQSSHKSISCLKEFPHLKRLAIRNSDGAVFLDLHTVCQPQQLTHLSMCDVRIPRTSVKGFISVVSNFTNLTSLVCHQMRIVGETAGVIHSILTCLPKLKHLSLSAVDLCSFPRSDPFHFKAGVYGGASPPALSSLELIGCIDSSFPQEGLGLMPHLNRLAVSYKHSSHALPVCHLKTWLCNLPQLSTLFIVRGPPVNMYVTSIPASVVSLSLCVPGLSSEDMAAVAVQVPNLLHLHIDSLHSHLGAHVSQIPQLFPKLRSLNLHHGQVPEKDFLQLHHLQHLESLEILDNQPHLSERISKLRSLTNYRLHITVPPHKKDQFSCSCVYAY